MKVFALVLYMCSGVADTCLQPFVLEHQFNSAYNCMVAGYDESKNKIVEIGEEDVNQYRIYIKFECLPQKIIVPKEKPKKEEKNT